jgi:hypothetical protein
MTSGSDVGPDFASEVQAAFLLNLAEIPRFIVGVLGFIPLAEGAALLSKAVFEPALANPQCARIFGIVEFNEVISEPLLVNLRKILTVNGSESILIGLSELLREMCHRPSLLRKTDEAEVPPLFQRLLVSYFECTTLAALP